MFWFLLTPGILGNIKGKIYKKGKKYKIYQLILVLEILEFFALLFLVNNLEKFKAFSPCMQRQFGGARSCICFKTYSFMAWFAWTWNFSTTPNPTPLVMSSTQIIKDLFQVTLLSVQLTPNMKYSFPYLTWLLIKTKILNKLNMQVVCFQNGISRDKKLFHWLKLKYCRCRKWSLSENWGQRKRENVKKWRNLAR